VSNRSSGGCVKESSVITKHLQAKQLKNELPPAMRSCGSGTWLTAQRYGKRKFRKKKREKGKKENERS
jgi:hypothetical protein